MKNLFTSVFFFLCIVTGFTQGVSVNDNGVPADASAMLDVSSHTKGVLVPRLRTNERISVISPAEGLLVYDIDTHSFWFAFGGIWKEILNSGTPIIPIGPAGGDLSGTYPNPNVVKIQNLDVAFGVPFDKQILKWDGLNNQWKGRNDSLILPYNVSFGSPTKLFGITNTNTTSGASAIYGKSGNAGSGITPAGAMGVWGDNSNGLGVVGTSNTGIGVFGFSFVNHGVYGYSTTAGFAGVKGSHANAGGVGVLGEVQNSGSGIMGTSISTLGKAGTFLTTSATNTDTTFNASTVGLGILSQFNISNSNNTKPVMDVTNAGSGPGLKVRMSKITGNGNGIDAVTQGTGMALYGRSDNGIGARFENTNAANAFPALSLGNNGLGSTMYINSSNTGQTGNVVDVTNSGTGFGLGVSSTLGTSALFTVPNVNSTKSDVIVQQQGLGRGVEINLSKSTNTNAGLYVNTVGTLGIDGFSAAASGIAVRGTTGPSANGGIGVLGQADTNDPNGIGVKGIAGGGINGGVGVLGIGNSNNPQAIAVKGIGYTHNEDVGAVTGINMTDGVGVYGESQGFDGIGVAGTVGNTSNHSVAAVFTNNYANNNRSVMELHSNGKGSSIFSDNTNLSNADKIIQVRNAGTGKFISLETNLGDVVTSVAKNGNIVTDGTMTVKGDKGIVRNSSGTQLRTEILSASFAAGSLPHYNEFNSALQSNVTFGTAFSSPPSVYIGNVTSGSIQGLTITVENVTTTGCTLWLANYTPYDFTIGATSYKIVAIGAE
ncbi:MAG: H-type lectin domain-containing protein [Saprospiraceae bacterium]